MDKLDKVISALGNCTDSRKCRDCPWDECEFFCKQITIPAGLGLDALELLRAKQPRVLTLEEAKQWNEQNNHEKEPVYIENIHEPDFTYAYVGDFRTSVASYKLSNGHEFDGYGETWRCWTARPTEKQMEETPWEG